jgi:hypothetical protein
MLFDVSMRVGTLTLPLPPGLGCTDGWWAWVSRCNSTHQLRLPALRAPSSGSPALPVKLNVSPALKVAPSGGDVFTGTGGVLGPLSEPLHDTNAIEGHGKKRCHPQSRESPVHVVLLWVAPGGAGASDVPSVRGQAP